jgi:hypothetical protein
MKLSTLYTTPSEIKVIPITRVWAMPNHETFKIRPIKVLLDHYVGNGWNWIDPFAGNNSPAKLTNDHNPETKAQYHMEALDFVKQAHHQLGFEGVLFDPPYSFTQVKEHYQTIGMATQAGWTNNMAFYEKVKSAICEKIKPGGYAINFGWNSNGFGKARGFEIVEIMLVAHGGSKNDTIVTVEKRLAPHRT